MSAGGCAHCACTPAERRHALQRIMRPATLHELDVASTLQRSFLPAPPAAAGQAVGQAPRVACAGQDTEASAAEEHASVSHNVFENPVSVSHVWSRQPSRSRTIDVASTLQTQLRLSSTLKRELSMDS